MKSNNFLKNLGLKLAFIFAVLSLLVSAFCFTACNNKSDSKINDPNFSYTETDNKVFSNGSFSYGTTNVDFTAISSLPRTSVTGWTKSSSSSDVNSGVIDVSDAGWKTLISKLYDDSDFLKYAQSSFGFNKDTVKAELKEELNLTTDPTSAQIKQKIIDDYFSGTNNKFPNPKTHTGATDNKVYMLNNYDEDTLGHGLNQNITSSSTINLEKGSYGKFTVWVKTQNLKDWNNQNFGAYIALNNSFNGTSQAQYRIQNIVTDTWKPYTLYVKADAVYNTTVTLVLGLGEDDFNAVEGTVYFDDVSFEQISEADYNTAVQNTPVEDEKGFIYASNNDVTTSSSSSVYLYDMSFDKYLSDTENEVIKSISDIKKLASVSIEGDYTTSNAGASGNKFGTATVKNGDVGQGSHIADTLNSKVIELTKASYTLTYTSTDFVVEPESYVYVEFYVKNELSKFGASTITFDIFEDINNDGVKDVQYKAKGVSALSEISEDWAKIGLMIKNNFKTGNRSFIIDVVVGPVDVATANTAPEFATGKVTITAPLFTTGTTVQYDDEDIETADYRIYSLFNTSASGSTALFGGMQQDYVEDSDYSSYSLTYSASDIGAILSRPATPNNYTGVVSNHIYIMDETDSNNANLETNINDRINGRSGSYAGLINTKYTKDYELSGINTALGFKSNEKDIQPLMIYNSAEDSYGYIGTETTISTSSYAKLSARVRVVGDAVAYVYLVNVSGRTKDVMLFDEDKLALTTPEKMMFEITSDMMEDDGWTTVTFYIATGATKMNFRLELWNGSRDGVNKSEGFVFFNDIKVLTTNAFNEPAKVSDAFTVSGNPLYEIGKGVESSAIQYTRKLTETEKRFNNEQKDSSKKISYNPTYVWTKNDTNIYAIYNTIDPVKVDPFETEAEEEKEPTGCTAKTDPATFWLSFSTILLGVVLIFAIIMLILKNVRHRRKANASDAKSHYKVTSRSRIYKSTNKPEEDIAGELDVDDAEVDSTVVDDEITESTDNDDSQKLDDYVYGEVEDFGEGEESDKTNND